MYILPNPQNIKIKNNFFRLKYNSEIIIDKNCFGDCLRYAKILKNEIKNVTGFSLEIVKGDSAEGQIYLTMKNKLSIGANPEGYELNINNNGIIINGNDNSGLLFGVQTLRQIIRQKCTSLPYMEIVDAPDIPNRGYYFDCTRGRIPTLEQLKKIADICSFYKLNQLQLYIEHTYLFKNQSEVWRDNTPLTASEIMEFDEYCRNINIELVPSLASFGHLYQLLRTNSFSHLCELEIHPEEKYSLVQRMWHHTIDITNDESFKLVTDRIYEYMQLFTSKYFNICADETFDLGKGKSKKIVSNASVTDIYVTFLDRLCKFVIDNGSIPMFWGDFLLSHPEKISCLPENAICLNWDYNPMANEETTKNFTKAGVKHLYVCPGVQSWNHLINNHQNAYNNIYKMCNYAHKYKAEGVLITDWGDCGHIAHPDFSVVGLIYGAAFSWNRQILPETEINKQISTIHYGDNTEKVVSLFRELGNTECVNWWNAVQYYEYHALNFKELKTETVLLHKDKKIVQNKIEKMEEIISDLYDIIPHINSSEKSIIEAYILMAKGQKYITLAGLLLDYQLDAEKGKLYARDLEYWLLDYKKLWRSVSKESELHRISDVIIWYADKMRTALPE